MKPKHYPGHTSDFSIMLGIIKLAAFLRDTTVETFLLPFYKPLKSLVEIPLLFRHSLTTNRPMKETLNSPLRSMCRSTGGTYEKMCFFRIAKNAIDELPQTIVFKNSEYCSGRPQLFANWMSAKYYTYLYYVRLMRFVQAFSQCMFISAQTNLNAKQYKGTRHCSKTFGSIIQLVEAAKFSRWYSWNICSWHSW